MKTSIGVLVFLLASVGFGQSGGYLITTIAGLGNPMGATPISSGDGAPALYAGLSVPGPMTFDSAGNLYIADANNENSDSVGRIRKITPQGIISTVAGLAGLGAYTVNGGIAFDQAGNLYIADTMNCVVRMITPQGTISTVAGSGCYPLFGGDGGPATLAKLYQPTSVAIDSSGDLYIADGGNSRIRMVTTQGIISTVAGGGANGLGDGGPATLAKLYFPAWVAVDQSGNLFIVDGSYRIRMVTSAGTINTIAGTGQSVNGNNGNFFQNDGGPATNSSFSPNGGALDGKGNIFISTSLWPEFGSFLYSQVRELIPASTAGCTYSLDQSGQSFPIAGGSNTVGVLASAGNCSWMAVSEAKWITPVTPTGIQTGVKLVTYTAVPIQSSIPRSGDIWIAGNSLTIDQAAIICSESISPKTITVPASGAVGVPVSVTATAQDCSWTAVANEPWILASPNTSVLGDSNVNVAVGPNTGAGRTGTITIAGQTISVVQSAKPTCNAAGVQLVINEGLGVIPAVDDFIGVGVVNVIDVQMVIAAVLGNGVCPYVD